MRGVEYNCGCKAIRFGDSMMEIMIYDCNTDEWTCHMTERMGSYPVRRVSDETLKNWIRSLNIMISAGKQFEALKRILA